MRFLADQDVYQLTVDFLVARGHDVALARDLGLQQASDSELLRNAKESGRILLSRDKDFGALVFLERKLSTGVILLRGAPSQQEKTHKELDKLLAAREEQELRRSFCVVEPGKRRVRRLRGAQ